jgi:ankyrin repeat protein
MGPHIAIAVACLLEVSALPQLVAGKRPDEVFKAPHLAELVTSACEGNEQKFSAALNAGGDPNGLSIDGGPPLLWAVYCGNLHGIDMLLKAGANPNYRAEAISPTFAAAGSSNADILRSLLKGGGDPNTDDGEATALRFALQTGIHQGNWENYYALLEGGADINRVFGNSTIAEWASDLRRWDKVKELLERGYDGDIIFIGRRLEMDTTPKEASQFVSKSEVKSMLEQRGVKFPIGPLRGRKRGANIPNAEPAGDR